MATWDDVRRLAPALPDTDETDSYGGGHLAFTVKDFVRERPRRASDLAALGDAAPSGPVLGARVAGPRAQAAGQAVRRGRGRGARSAMSFPAAAGPSS